MTKMLQENKYLELEERRAVAQTTLVPAYMNLERFLVYFNSKGQTEV
jgi:hypothetical protein